MSETLSYVDPFQALRFHFGMLLGAEDFETLQAYHRGKMRLHNAWLHGGGVVWGLGVDLERVDEIRVAAGLALDYAGHELYLAQASCLNLAAWYAEHRGDPDVKKHVKVDGDRVILDAHVVIRFRACLSREVPALMDPCEGAGSDTVFSRVNETVEIDLVAGPAPIRPNPYHRVLLLLGLVEARPGDAGDRQVVERRERLRAEKPEDQPALLRKALRELIVRESIEIGPPRDQDGAPSTLFPAGEREPVVLADVRTLTLLEAGDTYGVVRGAATIDYLPRPTLLPTAALQELLLYPILAPLAAAPPAPGPAPAPAPIPVLAPPPVQGPRIDPDSLVVDGTTVRMNADRALITGTVVAGAFSVASRPVDDAEKNWTVHKVRGAWIDSVQDRHVVNVRLDNAVPAAGVLVRVVARGTGATPLLGADFRPLAGAAGGPFVAEGEGHDFVYMRRSAQ